MKKENGSIAVFTLVALLFMAAFLIISYANIINNSKSLKEQLSIIKGIYYKSNDSSSYTDVYTDLRRKNRQNLTAYSTNSNILKLEKTFKSKLINYKIYGNSVQNGTPSPDNSIEIQSVGDETKNLINVPDFNVTFENSYYENSSTGYLLQPNCTYTLSFNYKINSASGDVGCGIGYGTTYYSTDINYMIKYPNQTNGKFVATFTTPTNIGNDKYLFVRFARMSSALNANVDFSSVQLELGSKATEYEPYGKYKIPIKVSGKNLFNLSAWSTAVTNNGVTVQYLKNEDCFLINGTATVTTEVASKYINIPNEPNTYYALSTQYVSGNIDRTNGEGSKYAVAYFGNGDAINTTNNWMGIYLQNNNEILTRINNKSYVTRFWFYISKGVTFNNYKVKIQLEEGKNATDYEPYQETIKTNIYLNEPLRKVGDYADYIDFKSGKVVRNIKSVVFNRNRRMVCI